MNTAAYCEKYNELTRLFLERFASDYKNENIVFSPMSIILLLGIVADAVQGKSRDEILRVIGGKFSYEELLGLFKEIQDDAAESGSLVSSNAVCIKDRISRSIQEEYPKRLMDTFAGKLFSSDDIVRDVNAWVKEKTNGMIEKAADESMSQMMACLMNAIAFDAEWMEEYEEEDIHKGSFYNENGTVSEVQMLESKEDTYIEDEFFTGFVKPYKDEKYSFMALLPKKKKNISFLLRLAKQMDFSKLYNRATYGTVYVTMPE